MGSPTSKAEITMLLERVAESPQTYQYKLLATNKASTMQNELNNAADEGFRLRR